MIKDKFCDASLRTVEDWVIETGEPMTVYAIGPANKTDLNAFRYYQLADQARAAFDERVNEGIEVNAALVRFYLNDYGYIQAAPERVLNEWITPAAKTATTNGAAGNDGARDDFDEKQEYAQRKYHEAEGAEAAIEAGKKAAETASDLDNEKQAEYAEAEWNAKGKLEEVNAAKKAEDARAYDVQTARENAEAAAKAYNEAKAIAQQKYNESVKASKALADAQNALNEAKENTIKASRVYQDAEDDVKARYQAALEAAKAENASLDALAQLEAKAKAAVNEFNEAEESAFDTGRKNLGEEA